MDRNYEVCLKSEKNQNTYCYDAKRGQWFEVSERTVITECAVPFQQVPEDVLAAAFREVYKGNA